MPAIPGTKPTCINPGNMPLPLGLEDKQDKQYHFHWIHKDPRYNVQERFTCGYKIVNKTDWPDVKDDPRVMADGTICHGDAVLAVCSFHEWQARVKAADQDSTRKLRAIRKSFHDKTKREGRGKVSSFEQDTPGPPGSA